MGEFETGAGEKERHRHLRAHLLRRLALVDDDAGIAITDVILTEILQGLRSQRDVRRRGNVGWSSSKARLSTTANDFRAGGRRCIRRALISTRPKSRFATRGAKATPVVQRIGETDPRENPAASRDSMSFIHGQSGTPKSASDQHTCARWARDKAAPISVRKPMLYPLSYEGLQLRRC